MVDKEYIDDINLLEEETKVRKLVRTAKKSARDSKVNSVIKEFKSLINLVYTMKDEDFVNGKFLPVFSRVIVRTVTIAGITFLSPTLGLISFITDKCIKKYKSEKQLKRLLKSYDDKLVYIEDKLNRTDDEKEKYKLIRLRSKLKSDIRKLDNTISKI